MKPENPTGPDGVSAAVNRILVSVLPHGEGLPLPVRATAGSSGFDLHAAIDGETTLSPGQRTVVPTGIRVAIPDGFEWQVRSRSGNAAKLGLTVLNSPGTVDSDYRGEVGVVLINLGDDPVTIRRGDRIAQAVLCEVPEADIVRVDSLPETGRGDGGFGHSDRG